MSSNKNVSQELPDGWVLCSSKSNPGRKYYFNKKTGKSSWTEPQADDKSGQSKEKSKREKAKKNEKLKKLEAQRKALKRKSDSQEGSSAKKKNKPELPSPEKPVIPCPSPSKHNVVAKVSKKSPQKCSPPQKTLSKNLANSRLTQLRTRLSSEAEKNVSASEKSPTKHKISPKVNETPPKLSKLESKSPQLNDTKCSATNQSPSSDSIQSIPSPSQFFAANKIISSMKAQLPEKYCDKTKQKDTFADIEEGICNQTAEYPFMKHPATPPQFSEASKLVSAIKSKLSYKGASKEGNVETFRSAQDRMNAMRARISNETSTSENNALVNVVCNNEAMDVDCKEISQNVPVVPIQTKEKVNLSRDNRDDLVLVVDTNVFIHELDFIKNVLNSHIKGYKEQPTLLVPWRVISELDRLKDNNNGNGALCKRAKSAMDYLYKSLPENSRIKGQSLRDSNSHIYPCEVPDDEILNCCLQQAERGKSVMLVSNDKNLCNKAVINNVKCISTHSLRPLLTCRAAAPLTSDARHCRDATHQLLATMLENEMRAKYNNLWQHVLFKAPPWTLDDVLQCLSKHWIAVFNEVFPRVVEHLITDLRNSLLAIESKDPKSVSQAEVSNFQELCLEIAKKCQIIPEYMELAKLTVERIEKNEGPEEDMAVVDAFEALWRVFSRYCDALSTALGIPHCIQVDTAVPSNEPLAALLERFNEFSHHVRALTASVHGVLSECSPASISRLASILRCGLQLLGHTTAPAHDSIRSFCDTCSTMLEEAHSKFAQLVDLLDLCQRSIHGN